MMKKYKIKGLDCPNCAAKLENALKKIEWVNNIDVDFMNLRLTIDCKEDDLDKVYQEIINITKKVEPNVKYYDEDIDENYDEHNEHYYDEHHNHHHKHNHSKDITIRHGHNHPIDKNKKEENKIDEKTIIIARVLICVVTTIISFLIKNTHNGASFIFFLIGFVVISYDVVYGAIKNFLKGKVLDEKFLMTIASVGAIVIGENIEAIAVMTLYQIGEMFQKSAVEYSRKSISSLINLKPEFARVKKEKGFKKERPTKVKIGEIIIVNPGEKIPLDGVVKKGNTSLDLSLITGESRPVDVNVGDVVSSGTLNLSSTIEIEVTTKYENSNVSRIVNLVEKASKNKAKSELFITKFASWYTPIVVILSIVVAVLNYLLTEGVIEDSFYIAISFLVVSCPCAIVISVPLAYFSGIGKASKFGILVKGGNYLETLANCNQIFFDKTGTLTKGEFKVIKVENLVDEQMFRNYLVSLEANFNHPIAKSICLFYKNNSNFIEVNDILDIPGYGIKGTIDSKEVIAGNEKLMKKENIDIPNISLMGSVIYLAINHVYAGHIVISDEVKENAKESIVSLRKIGVKIINMLSGDGKDSVDLVKKELDIDNAYSLLTPEEKYNILRDQILKKKKNKSLVFVGDGVNDAPSLSIADVGISMGGLGSDVAIEASDVVIMDDNIENILKVIKIAKQTKKVVIQNIVFALFIKIAILILVSFELVNMWMAVFADVGVALITIINSIYLLKKKI